MGYVRATAAGIVGRTVVTHTVTYFVVGFLAYALLDYTRLFSETGLRALMRPTSDPLVMAGPLFQPLRGLLYGIVFYLLRDVFFGTRRGWLVMWVVLMVVGSLNTSGPVPGSIEGLIYTTLPLWVHLRGLPEVLLQTFLLSVIVFYWVRHPKKRWIAWVMGSAMVIAIALPALGLLVGRAR